MPETFTKIYTANDNFEADLIRGILEEEKIFCFSKGYQHRSMLGKLGQYIDLDILVPHNQRQKALEIIEDYIKQQKISPDETQIHLSKNNEKSLKAALFYPFCFPGLGSYRIGNTRIGLLILFSGLACLCVMGILALKLMLPDGTSTPSQTCVEILGYCGLGILFLIFLDFIFTIIYYKRIKKT